MTRLNLSQLFRTTFLILAATMLAGNLTAQTIISGNFLHNGLNRTYRLYIPEIYDPSTPVPLLFNLHGYGSNNIEQEQYADFRPIADTANFIIVHPNGTPDNGGNLFWNSFGGASIDDVGFLSALIDTVLADYNIDEARIYSTGMSNGGFMSYDLACFLSDRITAVASVTGSMIKSRFLTCDLMRLMPVMQIHGTADATVPYNGNFLFAHIDTLVNFWVQHNNCLPDPEIIQIPDIDPTDGCTAEQHIYSCEDSIASVEFFKVIGGGHSWPGAPININITNMDFSASIEIWRFFRQYSLDQFITGYEYTNPLTAQINIFPNPTSNKITIEYSGGSQFANAVLSIIDLQGWKVLSQDFPGGLHQIKLDVSDWPEGLYLLNITNNEGITISRKIVIR
ncbi:MAG: T9SS type A sorting domain-containing protein [Bacteroidales bacterium]|nr:T9SS type A sorting domain-containing protein [Bacteroidales bacterium]